MIKFGREICGALATAERREWLVTNGIGGFAMGTVAGTLTRRYHGLLVAALRPPLGRTLLLAKLDEGVVYNHQYTPLHVNRWVNGVEEPDGYRYLQSFRLEGTTPVWEYAFADALLEKRVWMQPGANTTYVQYHLRRAAVGSVTLELRALINYRDYHSTTMASDLAMAIEPISQGLKVMAQETAVPYYLLCPHANLEAHNDWHEDFFLSIEDYRGQNDVTDDNYYAGMFRAELQPGQKLTFVASVEPDPELDGDAAYADRKAYEADLLERARPLWGGFCGEMGQAAAQLILAADQFIVQRAAPQDPNGRSVIAGYPWFSDWGRDTMISLPGLTLPTGRPELAAQILRTYAHYVDQGMLPNRFPDKGETPEYNTADATLWYFEAARAVIAATGDMVLLRDLFPVLADIINWHQKGTRYNIHADPADGLLYAGEAGWQLTWMDAKVGDWVVTPRIGKPVEINALWHNALRVMADFARQLADDERPTTNDQPSSFVVGHSSLTDAAVVYDNLADQARQGFQRFWLPDKGRCADVLDGPEGDDHALRPNQLFAVSLPHSPLPPAQRKAVVDVCAHHLLTSGGLRSLSPDHAGYIGHYGGSPKQRDGAYHQGTVWSWLMGPFVAAHWRVYQDKAAALGFLRPLRHHLHDGGLGSVSEIFDGDPPHTPRGCPAQAWGVAEALRQLHDLR
jgi:predicted glycogen debranching enzyme